MTLLPVNNGIPSLIPVQQEVSRQVTRKDQSGSDAGIFKHELESRVSPKVKGLTFSRHAQKRLDMRGIVMTPDGINRVEQAVEKLAEKGGRDSLIMAGALALVVNVPSRTVVTVMTRDSMQEQVVTNIDSAVFA